PSPSRVKSTPEPNWSRRALDHSYGVAGSRVVPTTKIGSASAASISGWGCLASIGHCPHAMVPHAIKEPNTGDVFSNSGITDLTSETLTSSCSSMQLIAILASVLLFL